MGRSIDVFRRIKQHKYAKANRHEDNYKFIRQLESRGVKWDWEVLRVIPDDEYPPDNERWYVIKLTREGHKLMNMRYGSEEHRKELAEQTRSPRIRSVADVRKNPEKKGFHASKVLRRRIIERTLKSRGVPDVAADKLLPEVLRRALVRQGVKSIEAGIPLSEIYGLRKMERLLRPLKMRMEAILAKEQESYPSAWWRC